jgi:hypothetical protein
MSPHRSPALADLARAPLACWAPRLLRRGTSESGGRGDHPGSPSADPRGDRPNEKAQGDIVRGKLPAAQPREVVPTAEASSGPKRSRTSSIRHDARGAARRQLPREDVHDIRDIRSNPNIREALEVTDDVGDIGGHRGTSKTSGTRRTSGTPRASGRNVRLRRDRRVHVNEGRCRRHRSGTRRHHRAALPKTASPQ